MRPGRVPNSGPLALESDIVPIVLRGPAEYWISYNRPEKWQSAKPVNNFGKEADKRVLNSILV